MKVEEYVVDVVVQKLEECEQLLSDEAYAFLDSHEGIDDIMVYQGALIDYLKTLEARFWCNEADDEDERIIKVMLHLINLLLNAMNELVDAILDDDDIIKIDED